MDQSKWCELYQVIPVEPITALLEFPVPRNQHENESNVSFLSAGMYVSLFSSEDSTGCGSWKGLHGHCSRKWQLRGKCLRQIPLATTRLRIRVPPWVTIFFSPFYFLVFISHLSLWLWLRLRSDCQVWSMTSEPYAPHALRSPHPPHRTCQLGIRFSCIPGGSALSTRTQESDPLVKQFVLHNYSTGIEQYNIKLIWTKCHPEHLHNDFVTPSVYVYTCHGISWWLSAL